MIEQQIIDAVSNLFEMPCVEYSGQSRDGGKIYIEFNEDIKVVTNPEGKQLIDAVVLLSVVGVRGRCGIGFLSGALTNFDSKSKCVKLEALDNREFRAWVSDNVFLMSKNVRVTLEVDFNLIREEIRGININGEGQR